MKYPLIAVTIIATATFGCGGSSNEKPADQAKPGAPAAQSTEQTPQQAAQSMAQGLEQMAKGVQALQTGADGKAIQVVDFEKLQDLLPSPGGWEKGKVDAKQMSSPMTMSMAEVTYRKGDAQVKVTITDAAFNQMFMMPFTMAMGLANERSSSGFKRPATYGGQPGHEEWQSDNKHAEVTIVVSKRYIVQVEGSDLASFDVIKEVAGQIDVAKLAALK
jgi:hypothetical protein